MIEPLRKYATFSGRARRAEFWWFTLFSWVVGIAAGFIDRTTDAPVLRGLLGLAFMLPSLAVGVRRLHDGGRSGWWLVLPVLSLVAFIVITVVISIDASGAAENWFIALGLFTMIASLAFLGLLVLLLVWFVQRGTDGSNRFGEDPLNPAGDFAEVFS